MASAPAHADRRKSSVIAVERICTTGDLAMRMSR
jgi:hypothetical protein